MSAAQIHLALLHFPIAGVAFGVLFLLWGVLREAKAAKMSGLVLLLLSGLTAVPVFLSGEPTEEIVEHKPNVTKALIETHEEAAELAFYVTLTGSALALVSLILEKRKLGLAKIFAIATLLLSLVSLGLLARAAHFGGMIRHDELRTTAEHQTSLSP